MRFFLGTPTVQASSASDLAHKQLRSYAQGRAAAEPAVREPTVDQIRGWGVEAAASAAYDLARPDAYGADREEATMLVRAGAVMMVTLRYARGGLDVFRRGLLHSAMFGSLRWDPSQPPPPVPPRLWPESTFLEPGVAARLKGYREDQAPRLAPAFEMSDDERRALAEEIEKCVARPDPPWAQVSRGEIEALIFALTGATTNPRFERMLRSVVVEVRTMHDLRGFALLMGRAATEAWRAGR